MTHVPQFPEGTPSADPRPVLITGGAGFIGSNLACRLLEARERVILFDNLSRPGVRKNADWLLGAFPDRLSLLVGDVRNSEAVRNAAARCKEVFHFAAQVAVTISLEDPVADFESNLRGTLNVLEALRLSGNPAPLIFTSTNKVYGALQGVSLQKNGTRYDPREASVREKGIPEECPLDLYSPYGCSKGAADQYVLDYARIYGMQNTVFRMSCIYGPRQFGTEDQGWVAHFLIRALQGRPIHLYGDGRQVRDLLFVEDLVDAFFLARTHREKVSGQAFNIGGGPENTVSLVELLRLIQEMNLSLPEVRFDGWRSGDQKYYVSDFSKFHQATGWKPRVGIRSGMGMLLQWLIDFQYAGASGSRIGNA